jgi:hypothetical protein
MSVWRSGGGLLGSACAALAIAAGPCAVANAEDDIVKPSQHFEFWTGAQGHRDVWSAYSGISVAPFAAIDRDGMRLRLSGGYGNHSDVGSPTGETVTSFIDALVGYHSQLGSLTVKVFAGLAAADRQYRPDALASGFEKLDLGGKVAVETWWNLGESVWTAVDLSWTSLHQGYAGRTRLGWRLIPVLSLGIEAGAVGNKDSDVMSAAAFLRYELANGEFSLTGGVSNGAVLDGISSLEFGTSTPFAMVNWLHRF